MSTNPSSPRDVLLSSARLLAQSHDLETRLRALADGAVQAIEGRRAILYLRDQDTGALTPAAVSDLGAENAQSIVGQLRTLEADDADAAAVAARERITLAVPSNIKNAPTSILVDADDHLRGAIYVPLVVDSPAGGSEIEGVLSVGFEGKPPSQRRREVLDAVASLAAVAALQSRQEAALTERSDWLDRLAHTDSLTGLANRRALERVLQHELARAARQGTEVCVAVFDVDQREAISVAHGEQASDDVLRRVGASLAETVRLVDTVARHGPGTFVVVAPGSAGVIMAKRAMASIERLEPIIGDETVTVSVGVARYPDDADNAEGLMAAAERALSDAKARGAGTILSAGGPPDAA